jgi:chromate transporter
VSALIELAGLMALLSLVSFGGGNAILPAMHDAVVRQHGWLTDEQFLNAYTLGRLAPGPGSLYVSLIGYHVAGVPGAAIATVALYLPPSILLYAIARASDHFADHPWKKAIERGLAPVVVGLLASGAFQVGEIAVDGPVAVGLALLATVVLFRTRLSGPVVILAGGAIAAVAARYGWA